MHCCPALADGKPGKDEDKINFFPLLVQALGNHQAQTLQTLTFSHTVPLKAVFREGEPLSSFGSFYSN